MNQASGRGRRQFSLQQLLIAILLVALAVNRLRTTSMAEANRLALKLVDPRGTAEYSSVARADYAYDWLVIVSERATQAPVCEVAVSKSGVSRVLTVAGGESETDSSGAPQNVSRPRRRVDLPPAP